MKYIVDRFEGDFAVLEDEKLNSTVTKKSLIPSEAKEGSVLIMKDNKYFLCADDTETRKKSVLSKFRKLREKNMQNTD